MPQREGHPDLKKVVIHPTCEGALIGLPVEEGHGFVTQPAPSHGLYFKVHESAYFVSATDIEEGLQRLYDAIQTDEEAAEVAADGVSESPSQPAGE